MLQPYPPSPITDKEIGPPSKLRIRYKHLSEDANDCFLVRNFAIISVLKFSFNKSWFLDEF